MQSLWSIQRVVHIHTEWWHTAAQEVPEIQQHASKAEPLTAAARGLLFFPFCLKW
jgi:hypothetical protein